MVVKHMRLESKGIYNVSRLVYYNPYCLDNVGFLKNYVIEAISEQMPWLPDDCKVLVITRPLSRESWSSKTETSLKVSALRWPQNWALKGTMT